MTAMTAAKRIARVFPRKTHGTPRDELAFIGDPGLFPPEVDEVHVSVAFTWDRKEGERLAEAWKRIAPVKLGGPAFGDVGEDFIPGMYLREGYVITSRGCPNNCWFCMASRREGKLKELPIHEGWIVQDNNLLACSEKHIRAVFDMLRCQPQRAVFTGGIEAARLKRWHVDLFMKLNPKRIFFAYDEPADYAPLAEAGRMLKEAGFTLRGRKRACYVLCGSPSDTFEKAETRCREAALLGFWPFAMVYRDEKGIADKAWRRFQKMWCRPAITSVKIKDILRESIA